MNDPAPVIIDVNLGDQVEVVAHRVKTEVNNSTAIEHLEMAVLSRVSIQYDTISVSYLDKCKWLGDYVNDDDYDFIYKVFRCDCQDKAVGEPFLVFVNEHEKRRMHVFPAYRKMTIRQWKQFVIDNVYPNVYGKSQDNFTFWTVNGALDNNRKTVSTTLVDREVIVFANKQVNEADDGGSPIFTANRYVPTVDAFHINTQFVLADYIHAVQSDDEESDEEDTSSATAVPSNADVTSVTDIASATDVANATDGAKSDPDDDDDDEGFVPVTVLDKIKKSDGITLNKKTDGNQKTIEVKVPLKKGNAKLYYNYGVATSIGEMKQCFVEKFNMEIHQFSIYLQGSPLENYDTIDTYVTPQVSSLDLVPKIRGGGVHKSQKQKQEDREKRFRVMKGNMKELTTNVGSCPSGVDSSLFKRCEATVISLQNDATADTLEGMVSRMNRQDIEAFYVATDDGEMRLQENRLEKIAPIFIPVLQDLHGCMEKCQAIKASLLETFNYIYALSAVNSNNRYVHTLYDMIEKRIEDLDKQDEIETEVLKRLADVKMS